MNVFKIVPIDQIQRLNIDPDDAKRLFNGPFGRGQAYEEQWLPLRVRRLEESGAMRDNGTVLGDYTSIGSFVSTPVFSGRARRIIEPLLGAQAQWFPLDFDECEYWIVNLLDTVELDPSTSVFKRFDGGKISTVRKYGFRAMDVGDHWLFKAREAPFSTLATDRFQNLVTAEGLTGFWFRCIWNSTLAPFSVDRVDDLTEILSRPEVYGPDGVSPGFESKWPADWKKRAQEIKKGIKH
jgi:hypothetical protein